MERRAGGLGGLGHQLHVANGGEGGDDESGEKGQPDDAADMRSDFSGQRVDASSQDITDDEQKQQARPDGLLEFCFLWRRQSSRLESEPAVSVETIGIPPKVEAHETRCAH